MIFDRTQNDIDTALILRAKIQSGETLTESERDLIERGTLTINTLNRIENKEQELSGLFKKAGYYSSDIVNREWAYSDFFTISDFTRILQNINILRKSFFTYSNTPQTPGDNYRKYQVINDVEKILNDLELMLSDLKNYYRECGTFESGE